MSGYRGGNRNNHDRGHQYQQSIPRKRPAADDEEDKWVAEEDRFVLKQAKRKAVLRVRGGRATPVDWLAVILRAIDKTDDGLDDNEAEGDIDVVDPEGVFERLDAKELEELSRDIETYLVRETSPSNKDFWNTMKVICNDRLSKLKGTVHGARGVGAVTADVDRMFNTKSYEELEKLERQIRGKLESDEDIDVDYWEHLLKTLLLWKAKAKLRKVSQELVEGRLTKLRQEQKEEAEAIQARFAAALGKDWKAQTKFQEQASSNDPDPLLKLRAEDKGLEVMDEEAYLTKIMDERRKVVKLGYVPSKKGSTALSGLLNPATRPNDATGSAQDSTSALYERELARGVNENEEVFTSEETVVTASKAQWAGKYRPRKPRYFNRVQMGYEWNKYNQTHYDHDNPPPKVVQGYKFNIFYPDLIDKTKAPTYKIEREGGRKRGQTFVQAGEEDTCLIRFMAGAPYEDIAFRVVDREWDYSAKRDRGFKSSFEKGILQLHFQFKKIYYRK